ncbi:MAG: bifunctional UDP-sugar hydrolase/5'-nucleotidase [Planctomycetota bacterium]|jgi:2',3'-cyclic-nucleotide 2'-phosphodiesterase (5'-nucleotidase family)|nr:bifunctional UDP-sugar hydrolase/5'-nucleotidase [Planctomycetota bacterium]
MPSLSRRPVPSLVGRLAALALVLAAGVSAGWAADEPLHLIVLHTNDVHGQVEARPAVWLSEEDPPPIGGLRRLAGTVGRVRAEAERTGAGVLVVDAGDWFQGTPEGLVDRGRAFVRVLLEVGYDAMCVGNHEFDHGLPHLLSLLADFRVPAVCANLHEPEAGRVEWVAPWKVCEVAGMRVGLVGLLTPQTPHITHEDAEGLRFVDPIAELARVRAELGDDVDWILPLTHLGVEADVELAEAFPDLPLIVGGHSHTFLREGRTEGETLIVQVGSKASAVGRVDLWFDADTKQLLKLEYDVISLLEEIPAEHRNDRVDEMCEHLVAFSAERMAVVVGELLGPLQRTRDRFRSSSAGNLICDAMRAALPADVAIQNRGGIRCDWKPGPITRRDLFELLPFGNHLVRLELPGARIVECVRAAVEGTAHSGLEFSGMVVEVQVDEAGGGHLDGILIGGEPIDDERVYSLVTNSFLADGGDRYLSLKAASSRLDDPRMLREMLEEYLGERGRHEPSVEQRYRRVEGR